MFSFKFFTLFLWNILNTSKYSVLSIRLNLAFFFDNVHYFFNQFNIYMLFLILEHFSQKYYYFCYIYNFACLYFIFSWSALQYRRCSYNFSLLNVYVFFTYYLFYLYKKSIFNNLWIYNCFFNININLFNMV